jgi:hypothetical protein
MCSGVGESKPPRLLRQQCADRKEEANSNNQTPRPCLYSPCNTSKMQKSTERLERSNEESEKEVPRKHIAEDMQNKEASCVYVMLSSDVRISFMSAYLVQIESYDGIMS